MPEPLLTPEQLVALALEPIESESDGQRAKGRSAEDIARLLDMAAASGTPARSAWGRVRMATAIPPGANGR